MTEPMPTPEEMLEPTTRGLSLLARHALGQNYWLDDESREFTECSTNGDGKKQTTCGLVEWGPHGVMLGGLIDVCYRQIPEHLLMMTSRGGLKTSAVQAAIMQMLLKDPNHCIMVYMATYSEALKTIGSVKRWFESDLVKGLFGDYVPTRGRGKKEGEQAFRWSDDQLFLSKRTNISDRNPNLAGGGLDRNITGGHFHTIFVDDPVNWQQVRSLGQMEKAKSGHRQLRPILNPGGRFVITMTPYDENDLAHHIQETQADLYKQITLDCGMEAVSDGKGGFRLEGDRPRFPHHTRKHLEKCLQEMHPPDFNAQMALKITNPADQIFFRENFEEVPWEDRFEQMSCYVLTDTATSDSEFACYSVAALIAVDHNDVAYLFDLMVGRFLPNEFGNGLLDMMEEWQSRLKIVGVTMETTSANQVYGAFLKKDAKERNIRMHIVVIPRSGNSPSKNRRIRSLTTRMASGHFKVVETCRRDFVDKGVTNALWNPRGFKDEGHLLPGGELVEEFVRFRGSGGEQRNIDICDALADLQGQDARGNRFVKMSPKPWGFSRSRVGKKNSGVYMGIEEDELRRDRRHRALAMGKRQSPWKIIADRSRRIG